jgi:hypothetical protein
MTFGPVAPAGRVGHDGAHPRRPAAEHRTAGGIGGHGSVRTSRLPLLTALAVLSLVGVAQPVAAISETNETGNVGDWEAFDELALPGARCFYAGDQFRLDKIQARAPRVFSFRPNGQKVGWRLKIVKSHKVSEPNNYADETVYQSKFQKARATLSKPADLTKKTWIREGSLADPTIRFKVWVIIKWYKPSNGKPEGTATYRYDWFRQTGPGGLDKTNEDFFCYRAPF